MTKENLLYIYKVYISCGTVTTDSRHVPQGSLFVALHGASFDGNRFASAALEAGAAAVVVDDETVVPSGDDRYLPVEDTLKTLQALATLHRQHFRGPVVQVTGTNGKTTTKELLAAVLTWRYHVLFTEGNLNNHIGVPLTLLRLRPGEHDIAIIETGANHPGEIADLARIVQPDYGLITNVGRAHLEGFGSFEGVKRTKGELYDYLLSHRAEEDQPTGIFVNTSNADLSGMLQERGIAPDDPHLLAYCHDEGQPRQAGELVRGSVAACAPLLTVSWSAAYGQTYEAATHLIGDYNLDNVLAAVAVGLHFGVASEEICAALADYRPSLGRSELRQTGKNTLIVDAYNANLTSMLAALGNFRRICHPHKMVILGDMKELGDASEEAHSRIVREVADSGVETAWFVGEAFAEALRQAPPAMKVRAFADVEAVKEALSDGGPHDRLILIKGSNSTRLHQLPELL